MNPIDSAQTKGYDQLLAEYRNRKTLEPRDRNSSLIVFEGIEEGKDAYNPSGPFSLGEWNFSDRSHVYPNVYQWARVESRTKQDAVARLFEKTGEHTYSLIKEIQPMPIEDPFVARIDDEMVVGGVEISKDKTGLVTGYRTIFYRGKSFEKLELFAAGPDSMKDIRLAKLSRSLLVFTRPYIPLLGRMVGRIAVTNIHSLEELTPERLAVESTEILHNFFVDTEWGGVNDVCVFENGLIGALCHVAKFDEHSKRHYAAAAFVMNPETKECSPIEIIAERADFPNGPIKIMPENLNKPEMYDDLADVIFSSRLTIPESADQDASILSSPTLELTCGLSDAAAGTYIISNPFSRLIAAHFPAF